jgi:hypothetical protein
MTVCVDARTDTLVVLAWLRECEAHDRAYQSGLIATHHARPTGWHTA